MTSEADPVPIYRAVLFDLDGTLVDSATDIRTAANRALGDLGFPGRALAEIRQFIGDGVVKLMERAIGSDRLDGVDLATAVERFRGHYDECLVDTTGFFPGVADLLDTLDVPMSIVSNKPEAMCVRIARALAIDHRFRVIAGGDTFEVAKPDPLPFRETASRMGTPVQRCVVVGDGRQDMIAGRAAGCHVIGVTWGQNDEGTLREAGAHEIATDARELRKVLNERLEEAR